MSTYNKPLPIPNPITEPFWKAAKNHELLIQHCTNCNEYIFPPREICPRCMSFNLEWVRASGKGSIFSYTVVRVPPNPGFNAEVPYIVAIIELDEGPHLMSNLINGKIEDISLNMPVTVVFDDVTPEFSLVKFRPL
jgi:uncharacterized OB-fold protein